ncbi:ABC transporter permease [Alteromonas macleodii]|uniref:Binding-protein-dependent transport system inner membrane component family protein n=1 Tax=Alteromonas macleodii TaxID=28108 RepID=A0AB36FN63_ALTMA|nr:ABC transporter permease [Alteromonas macleodii]OES24170.1 binding-protein-dependent transport system inner membrane component family protein [Alteromonas macleodii]OES24804.1 binding-protein-dependent transport system inner membrane component family protein [Alteromonas macleodii]OES25082.1 binding-protein-dependent transport system inner membrane component family protein [Alteromonas macleodii]OES39125.1 binding-protein-dependent transport system inner membrane component family protein [Al
MKRPQILGLHAEPSKQMGIILAVIPFVMALILYFTASHLRHIDNEKDKLLPTAGQMVTAMERMAFTPDRRSGEYLLLEDTTASLGRIGAGVAMATALALFLGLNMGLYKGARGLFNPFITFIAMVPPLAILPILFISFGVGEWGKIMLIFIGTFPIMTRDINLYVKSLPKELIVKAQTLGANDLALTYRIIMPMVIPRLIDSLRLSLGSAWVYLIAAEAISATDGLGYRIFLMRRYLNMDVIIPYVLWIISLGLLIDLALRVLVAKKYPWYLAKK